MPKLYAYNLSTIWLLLIRTKYNPKVQTKTSINTKKLPYYQTLSVFHLITPIN